MMSSKDLSKKVIEEENEINDFNEKLKTLLMIATGRKDLNRPHTQEIIKLCNDMLHELHKSRFYIDILVGSIASKGQ